MSDTRQRGTRRPRIAILLAVAGALIAASTFCGYWYVRPTSSGYEVPLARDLTDADPLVVEAIEAAATAARRAPDDAQAIGQLGRVYHANRFYALARQCYQIARSLDAESTDWPYYLGQLALREGRPDAAAEFFRQAAQIVPSDPTVQHALAQAYLDGGNLEQAKEAFARYNALQPHSPWGHIGLGKAARREKDYAAAARHLETACSIAPAHYEATYLLATTCRLLGRHAEARRYLQRLTHRDSTERPDDPYMEKVHPLATGLQARLSAADALLKQGRDLQQAERIYRQVLELDRHNYQSLTNLGELYRRQQRYAEATPVLEQAVAAQPQTAYARVVLAHVLLDAGNYGRAESEAAAALKHDPSSVRGCRVLGYARMKQQQFAEAIPPLRTALERDPDLIDDRYVLAVCYYALGQKAEALVALNDLLQRSPDHRSAATLLDRIRREEGL